VKVFSTSIASYCVVISQVNVPSGSSLNSYIVTVNEKSICWRPRKEKTLFPLLSIAPLPRADSNGNSSFAAWNVFDKSRWHTLPPLRKAIEAIVASAYSIVPVK